MGGRGASSSRGGGSGASASANKKLEAFQKMSPTELESLASRLRQIPNSFYTDQNLNATNPTQRLVTDLGMNDKPLVLEDAEYDKMISSHPDLIQIYRGVQGNYQQHKSAEDVRKDTLYGDITYIGDGIHGHGLYFSTDASTAKAYAGGSRNGAITQAVLNPKKVKAITEDNLRQMARNDPQHYNRNTMRDISQYALYKGYNTIIAVGGNGSRSHANGGEDFYIPLDRSVLICRKTTNKNNL